jgi:uroporphyrinogen decarboxylase
MTPREIVLQVIKRQSSHKSRIPAALLSAGTWTFRQKGLTLKDILENPELAAPAIVECNAQVHSDIVWPGSGYHNLPIHMLGGKVQFRKQGNIDVSEPLINDLAAIDQLNLDQLDTHEWVVAIRRMIAEVNSAIGDTVLVGTSSWGPFTLAGQLYGVERLMSGLYKDKAGIRALLDFTTELCYRYLAPMIHQGAAILSIAEPTASGDLISYRHFEEFVAPYLAKINSRLKARGALVMLHICGNIKECLGIIPSLGVDILSLDYKVDLAFAQKIIGGKIAIAGNVNPVLIKESTLQQVVNAAEQCIQQANLFEHYILMPGCDIPPGVPLENVKAFIAAANANQIS